MSMKQGFVMVNILLCLWHFKNANNLVDHIDVLCQTWQWMRCYSIPFLINECDTNEWNLSPNTTNVHGKKDFEPFECSSIFFFFEKVCNACVFLFVSVLCVNIVCVKGLFTISKIHSSLSLVLNYQIVSFQLTIT